VTAVDIRTNATIAFFPLDIALHPPTTFDRTARVLLEEETGVSKQMADMGKRMRSKIPAGAAQRVSRTHGSDAYTSDDGWSGISFDVSMLSVQYPPVTETCGTNQMQATFVINTATWAVETEWSLLSSDGSTVLHKPDADNSAFVGSWDALSGDVSNMRSVAVRYPDHFVERTIKCLDVGAAYTLLCRDVYGDGWHGVCPATHLHPLCARDLCSCTLFTQGP
jgi:hypothetical protein